MSLPTAFTTPKSRLTRSKRALDITGASVNGSLYSADGSTMTTKRSSTSRTARGTHNHVAKVNIQPSADISSVANVEENITLTCSKPLRTPAAKFGKLIKKRGEGANGTKPKKSTKVQPKRAAKAPSATRPVKRSNSAIPIQGEPGGQEMIAGRSSARKRYETPRNGVASESTICPLADLSEAYGVAEEPIVFDKVTPTSTETPTQEQGTPEFKGQPETTQVEEKLPTGAFIISDIRASLRPSAKTTGEARRFPNIPQRPSRGVKRVLDSGENTSESKRIQEFNHSSRVARLTKRRKQNPAGGETQELTSTPEDENTSIPHVSQSISIASSNISPSTNDTQIEVPVPMPAFDWPDSISESVLISPSTNVVPVPPTTLHDVLHSSCNQEAIEKAGEATQEQTPLNFATTRGSSWLSSAFELRNFHFEGTLYNPSWSEIEGGRSEAEGEKEDAGVTPGCRPCSSS